MRLERLVSVLLLSAVGAPAFAQAPARPEHAILLVIDGLSYLAPERVDMKNLKALMARGVHYRESYSAPPQHPHSGEWAASFDSSIPNPILVAGTIFLRPGQKFVQSSFFPLKFTAHIANELTYKAINEDFHFTFQAGGNAFHAAHGGKRVDDDENMFWTLNVLRRWKPVYMRVHLQDTGAMGSQSRDQSAKGQPWYQNIWAEGSPYRQALLRADAHIGRLVEELRNLGTYDKTILFITGDHGQTATGWHPPFAQDAWPMPVVLAGPGIKAGQRFPYSEQIDIVPTLCYLMGVKPPENADGRIMAEALANPPATVPPRRQDLKELSVVLAEADLRITKLRDGAKKDPGLQAVLAEVERDFYDVERLLQWHRFGTVAKLVAHNRQVLAKIPASIQ